MTYSALVAWIEAHFPKADFDLSVEVQRKRSIGVTRLVWSVNIWETGRRIEKEAFSADVLKSILEDQLGPPLRLRFDSIDPEKSIA